MLDAWASLYAVHAAIRTVVSFVHVAALIAAGGCALAADRSVLAADPASRDARLSTLAVIAESHRVVLGGLALVFVSGLLLFAADVDALLYSPFFWAKMLLVALLLANGAALVGAERDALGGPADVRWARLRRAACASLALWFATTLAGVALPNVG